MGGGGGGRRSLAYTLNNIITDTALKALANSNKSETNCFATKCNHFSTTFSSNEIQNQMLSLADQLALHAAAVGISTSLAPSTHDKWGKPEECSATLGQAPALDPKGEWTSSHSQQCTNRVSASPIISTEPLQALISSTLPPNVARIGNAPEGRLFTSVHWCCQCPPKGQATNKTVKAT